MASKNSLRKQRKKHVAVIVPETHWDRAWYQTFQEFRVKLVNLVNNLISILEKDSRYKCFTLDGQTIVLEDYLEIHPEKEKVLRELISSGRILVGPWYVLPDEFLVSGEALIRNLMIGGETAGRFGKVMSAGYLPDPFGHISQLPQILRGFGIDNFIFTRGMPQTNLGTEFIWAAPDGESTVLAIHQTEGYCNASLLGYPVPWGDKRRYKFDMNAALKRITEQTEKLASESNCSYLLFNNGCDHMEAQPEIPDIIEYANKHLRNVRLMHGSFVDYIRCVKSESLKLGKYRGELRSPWKAPILPGTLSSRIYIKQANDAVQMLVEKWVEPVSALAWFLTKENYPAGLILQTWKYIIQNHPHDDICGCSVDQVHRENMNRFSQAHQICEVLVERGIEAIAGKIDSGGDNGKTSFIVFNSLTWERSDLFEVELDIPVPAVKSFMIRDNAGREIPHQIRKREKITRWEEDRFIDVERIRLALHDSILPMGYKKYLLEEGKPASFSSDLKVGKNQAGNSLFNLKINSDGTLKIMEKKTGSVYDNCLVYEDTEDSGDEYNYSPIKNTETYTTKGGKAKVTLVEKGPVLAAYRIEVDLTLPKALTADRGGRARQRVKCPLVSYVTVYEKSPRIDVRVEFDNRVKDHRLRVLFGTGIETESSLAGGHFTVERRPVDPLPGEGLIEKVSTHPQKEFVMLNNGKRGLAVISRGLPEYEVIRGKKGNTIAVTLLRAVGWLSRDDLLTRHGGAGPSFPAPEAQCQGKYVFNCSIVPHSGRWERTGIHRLVSEHSVPLKGKVVPVQRGTLLPELSFLSVEPANLAVTALKKAESGNAVVVRFFNTTGRKVSGRIRCIKDIRKAVPVDLREKPVPGKQLRVANRNEIRLEVKGNKIVTIKLYLK